MNVQTTIKNILFIALWLCIGVGMFTLLLAAISKKKNGVCKNYTITIKGTKNNSFIDQNDIDQVLKKELKGNIKGQPISTFNLDMLEKTLKRNTWINKVDLYFDNRDVLHAVIKEKVPVARVFTVLGNSFYIDSLGRRMPLSEKTTANVPVFTSFPDKIMSGTNDYSSLNSVRKAANFIYNDPFWMAQVSQIDIKSDGTFEMIPVVGNHVVKLGNAKNIDKKFHRLYVFYKNVLSKTGFDKYKVIDVQFNGQVIASHQNESVRVDSIQVKKNFEKLLQQSKEAKL
jgi:cell division protein FtsQ